ncbi:hypothetical protein V8G54_030933 [Vigna mungo]|uniref:Uncharacterized protein n=1 Tax=Vigna mungo TaxID=3915 RepID=A0AAQ3MXD8_VIGMU
MAAGKDERRDGGGRDGRDNGVALLVDVDLAVPAAPDLGRGKHAATSAHVAEGSLAGTVGSSTGNTGDTGDGTTRSPGLGGCLVASPAADGVGLAAVLGDVGVYEVYDVRADGGPHDVGDGNGGGGVGGHVALEGLDGDKGTGSCGHCDREGVRAT